MKTIGIYKVAKFFKKYQAKVESQLDESLMKAGKKILNESNKKAPKDTGEMIEKTDVVKVKNNQVNVKYNTDYSLYVHEDMEARHNNGEPKFLERATNENADEVIRDIARDISKIRV